MPSRHKNGKKPSNTLPKPSNATPTTMSSGQIVLDHIATSDSTKRHWKMPKNASLSTLDSHEDIREKELLCSSLIRSTKLSMLIKRDSQSILTMLHSRMILKRQKIKSPNRQIRLQEAILLVVWTLEGKTANSMSSIWAHSWNCCRTLRPKTW